MPQSLYTFGMTELMADTHFFENLMTEVGSAWGDEESNFPLYVIKLWAMIHAPCINLNTSPSTLQSMISIFYNTEYLAVGDFSYFSKQFLWPVDIRHFRKPNQPFPRDFIKFLQPRAQMLQIIM